MPDRNDGASRGLHRTDIAGAVIALIWAALVIYSAWPVTGGSGPGLIMTILLIAGPVALIWVICSTLRTVRALRDEAAELQAALAAIRSAPPLALKGTPVTPAPQRPAAIGRLPPMPAVKPAQAEDQPSLALGQMAEDAGPPLSMGDFIKALDFPESEDDRDGFRALRRALQDGTAARTVRAAQDVLTLLSQVGIYMDDLVPDHAHPDVWRKFAKGERGMTVAALGGIRDRESLALTATRMREDVVFRDAGHHFLRAFDKTFAAFEPGAADDDIALLSDTRTARAFMLIGRVTGTFD